MWILDLFRQRKRRDKNARITKPRVRVTILCGPSFYEPTRTLPPASLFRNALFC